MLKIIGVALLIPAFVLTQVHSHTTEVVQARAINNDVICGTTEHIMGELKKYNEKLIWSGKDSETVYVTVWQNVEEKTFSILKTTTDGKSTCLISSGQLFVAI